MTHAVAAFAPSLLRDRVALVTGGGTGICRGIAHAFASLGCNVAILSRSGEHLAPTVAELRGLGVNAAGLTADVRKPEQVGAAMEELQHQFGRLDILVNGAAGNFICAAEELSPNGFGTVIDIDLKGTFNVSRAAFPLLRVRGGAVLNISATLQLLGTAGQVHASAAKAGVDSLTRTLAVEWGSAGVRVNGLAPGPVDGTEGVKRLTTDESRRRIFEKSPLGRMASIEEIASTAVFLCSEAASFITGVTVVVDGGLWLRGHVLGTE
jgi:peroxisomal 2,4-dienoyl-CoA reductase